MDAADSDLVDRLELAWHRLRELGRTFGDAEWSAPTECPGWDVKDHVAHLTGLERRLLDPPHPDPGGGLPAVHEQLRRWNDADVARCRDWAGPRVLAEFEVVTAARLAALRRTAPAGFDAPSWTPVGPGTVRDLLGFRILDTWVHDQDVRRAVGRPGHREGPVAEHTLGRLVAGLPFVVGRRVCPPEGTTVVFEVHGPAFPDTGRVAVGTRGGRAALLPDAPGAPTVTLALGQDDFVRLTCGRGDPEAILAGIAVTGDTDLGRRVVTAMSFMP